MLSWWILVLFPFWPCLVFLILQQYPLRSSMKLLIIYCKIHFSQRSLYNWFQSVQHKCEVMKRFSLAKRLLHPQNNFLPSNLGWRTVYLVFLFLYLCSFKKVKFAGIYSIRCLYYKRLQVFLPVLDSSENAFKDYCLSLWEFFHFCHISPWEDKLD